MKTFEKQSIESQVYMCNNIGSAVQMFLVNLYRY